MIKIVVYDEALLTDPGCLDEFESVGSESVLRAAQCVQRRREMSRVGLGTRNIAA